MARTEFQFDPDFDDNVYHASNKSRSSLAPLFNLVRKQTDEIAARAKSILQLEAALAEQSATSNRNKRFGNEKNTFLEAKARAFALTSAYNSLAASMGTDNMIYGRVAINRKGSGTLEFGGADPVAEIGKGTGNYLVHPAYAFLRRAMESVGT